MPQLLRFGPLTTHADAPRTAYCPAEFRPLFFQNYAYARVVYLYFRSDVHHYACRKIVMKRSINKFVRSASHKISPIISDVVFSALDFRGVFGFTPNYLSPKTFNEKVHRRILFEHDPLFVELADKVRVKTYVRNLLGADIVIPTLFSGNSLPPKQERNWSPPFVIKANNASGANIFVHTPVIAWSAIEAKVETFLNADLSKSKEKFYAKIKPQILVEPFMGSNGKWPVDYKLFVFGGRAEFIQVHTDRETNHKNAFYDRNWNKLHWTINYPKEIEDTPRPTSLERLILMAETLAKPFSFVRVDLYEIWGKPYFGEMTFTPEAGFARIRSARY